MSMYMVRSEHLGLSRHLVFILKDEPRSIIETNTLVPFADNKKFQFSFESMKTAVNI